MARNRFRSSWPANSQPGLSSDLPNLAHQSTTPRVTLSQKHHWRTLPAEALLTAVLIVPGPRFLPESEVAARRKSPSPRTRRSGSARDGGTDSRWQCGQPVDGWRGMNRGTGGARQPGQGVRGVTSHLARPLPVRRGARSAWAPKREHRTVADRRMECRTNANGHNNRGTNRKIR